jgi:hypothetical protein
MARNNIELKLIRGNTAKSNTTKPDLKKYKEMVNLGRVKEEMCNPAMLISLVDYPVVVKYGKSEIRLSPRSREKVADHTLLDKDSLTKDVALKKLPGKKAQPEKVKKSKRRSRNN